MKTLNRLARRLAPPPRLTLSQWADAFRRLSPESSAEPGRWDTSRTEYQRGIMDAMTDPRVERVVLMTSARVGKTQTLNNLAGFHIHQDPASMLVVLPSESRADEWVDDEFDPMVRDTPALRAIMGERKSRKAGDRRKHRAFPGGRLYVVGANAPSGLAAKTVRVVIMDEVDRYPPSAGEEGDPATLAEKRASTIWNRKIVLSSTPTIAGRSRIETEYLASDRRRFWVPCPHCQEMQTLRWDQVRWPDDKPEGAGYVCAAEGCGTVWTDAQRWAAIRRGEWRAEGEFRGIAGFHLNELYSPWRRLTDTVKEFLAKKGSPATLMPWINTALGETWQDRGEAPDWERLAERRQEEWPPGTAPRGVTAVTAGVDVQGERIEVYVWGWGRGMTSWLLAKEVFDGRPDSPEVWSKLVDLLGRSIPREGGGALRIMRCAVDSGAYTMAVYTAVRRMRDPRVIAIKGLDRWGHNGLVMGPTYQDVSEGGKKLRRGMKLWTVASSALKQDLYRRLWLVRGDAAAPPGWVFLPKWLDGESIKQMVAEQLVTVKDRRGYQKQEWQVLGSGRNEALDCAVYARAALYVAGADRSGDRFWDRLEADLAEQNRLAPEPANEVPDEPASPPRPDPPAAQPPKPPARRTGRSGYLARIGR